ncbi:MAG TPA: ATP-dependent helicase C-terminal domain-containing protein, partial [bacterium]|nr:ATP-dependent helicase C-terminal domain-containing protein [bacterium]
RLGVLVVRGEEAGSAVLAAACAALLEERDSSGISRDPDARLRLEALREGFGRDGGNEAWRRAVMTEMERILRRTGAPGGRKLWTAEEEARAGDVFAHGFPDRLARRDPDGTYRLVTGRMARFAGAGPGSKVHVTTRAAAPWIVAMDADAGETAGLIRLAAPVAPQKVDAMLAATTEEELEIRWEALVPRAFMVRRAGRIVLTERPARPTADQVADSFFARLSRQGMDILPWNEGTRTLIARMRFFSRARPEAGLGDLSNQGLAARAGEWLRPFLKLESGQVLGAEKLRAALHGILGSQGARLAEEAPESITLPTGGKRKIDYDGDAPAVEARIQEVFGLSESPRVCGVPLTFRLLSPSHRPLQVTRDLAGFWKNTYAEVRKEMRGRYPKHYWPENPLEAEPTSGVRPKR